MNTELRTTARNSVFCICGYTLCGYNLNNENEVVTPHTGCFSAERPEDTSLS